MNRVDALYLHFPLCLEICNYCDFYKQKIESKDQIMAFEETLKKAMPLLHNLMNENCMEWSNLDTLYIGGGTPSLWGKSGVVFMQNFFRMLGVFPDRNTEFTMELNPSSFNKNEILSWMEVGANRFSVGVQTLNDQLLPHLGRMHGVREVYQTLEILSSLDANYSVDLMLGLPFSEKKFKRDINLEINKIMEFNPQHFSIYFLTTQDHYKYAKDLPSEEYVVEEYLQVTELLSSYGFEQYEVSNFCLPGKMSRHNNKYWRGENVMALGPSATGFMKIEKRGLRYKWRPSGLSYSTELLSEKELKLERFYLNLRTKEGVRLEEFFDQFEIDKLMPILERWIDSCRINYCASSTRLRPTSQGMILLDGLIDQIFSISSDLL